MKWVFLLVCLFPSLLLSQSKEDSLQLEYDRTTEDSTKVKILHQLAQIQANSSHENAKNSIVSALELALKTDNDRLKVKSYNKYSDFLRTQSMDDSAVVTNNLALKLAQKIKFRAGQSDALVGLGASYWRKGNFEKARSFTEKNIALATEMNDPVRIAHSYMRLGSIHAQSNEYTKAMELYTMASAIYLDSGEMEKYVLALGNIGFVQRNLENFENAKNYFAQADSISKLLNFTRGRAFSAYNLSIIYRNMGELDLAITSNLQAIVMYERLGDKKRVAYGKYTMGKIYWEKEDYREALNYYVKALEISKQVDDSVNIGHTYDEIAKCYHRLKENDKAKEYLLKAEEVARGIKLDILSMNVYRNLSQIYEDEGDFEHAYHNMKGYSTLRDSLYTKEKRELATDIEAKYQNEQKVKEIALLESDRELQTLQLNKRGK